MTDTAEMADIVIPATMFVEHDDIYRAGGQNRILLGPKLVEPPATVRTNLFVIEELAKRLGVDRPARLRLHAREMVDRVLEASDLPGLRSFPRAQMVRPPASFRGRALPQRIRTSGR